MQDAKNRAPVQPKDPRIGMLQRGTRVVYYAHVGQYRDYAEGSLAQVEAALAAFDNTESAAFQVRRDLQEQRRLGVRLSPKVLTYVVQNERKLQTMYDEDGLSISALADAVVVLA